MASTTDRNRGRLGIVALSTVLLTGSVAGCGGDDASDGRVPTMIQAPRADRSSGNDAPTVEAIAIHPARPAPGRTLRAAATVADPDGDSTTVSYLWQDEDGLPLGRGQLLETRGMDQGALIEVIAVASDGEEESEPASHRFRLSMASLEVDRVEIDSKGSTVPGAIFAAVVEATDESRHYDTELEWQVNGKAVGSGRELDTTRFSPGDVVVLRVHLEAGGKRSREVSSRPVRLARADAPEILSKPTASLENGLFRYSLKARSKVAGAQLSYELLKGPEGMKVDEKSGVVSWRPAEGQQGRFEVEVAVKDQWGTGVAQSFALQAEASQPPAAAR